MRPIIGITTPNTFRHIPFYIIYIGIWLMGGRPLALRTLQSIDNVEVDGLIVGGGTDVFPGLFQNDAKHEYLYDHNRDEMEIAWLNKAARKKLPVLGICRGAQMMNVMNGGNLHMDIAKVYEDADYPQGLWYLLTYRKTIFIEEGSLLHTYLGCTETRVNSLHSQSINKVGDKLNIVAKEKNGIVQAIERRGHPFYLGVQFHPEFLLYRRDMRRLFRGFIEETIKRRERGS